MLKVRDLSTNSSYQTTAIRCATGLFAGAALGAFAFTARELISTWRAYGTEYVLLYSPRIIWNNFVPWFVVWTIGLTLVAGPMWWSLHRTGRRRWNDAVLLGACLPFLVILVLSTVAGTMTAHEWARTIRMASIEACIGAVVGLFVWRISYRQA